jgi:hypothetical protein
MLQPTVSTKIKTRSNSVVFYPSFELFNTNRGKNKASLENLGDNRVKGFLSKKSAAKIRDLVENWVNSVKAYSLQENRKLSSQITFVTLTLPSNQMHSDKDIKRRCLNHFLIKAKRAWKAENYIWKAEPQKNGNIHFHIIFDKYVEWRKVRNAWNKILDPLGYIDNFEKKNGHRDPNSTDIHSLYKDKKGNNITFVGAYMAKYMSKTCTDGEAFGRALDGRIWGCSDSVRDLECFTGFDDQKIDIFFKCLKENSELRDYKGEFFRVFCGNWYSLADKNKELMSEIHFFYVNQYKKMYGITETR